MDKINKIIKNTNDYNVNKINWTKAWSGKYLVLKSYRKKVDIPKYANEIRKLLNDLEDEYNYNSLDAMLVLKDILVHEYLDNKEYNNEK